MLLLVLIVGWAMLGLLAFAIWFSVTSVGLTPVLVGVPVILVGMMLIWWQFRQRPKPLA